MSTVQLLTNEIPLTRISDTDNTDLLSEMSEKNLHFPGQTPVESAKFLLQKDVDILIELECIMPREVLDKYKIFITESTASTILELTQSCDDYLQLMLSQDKSAE